MAEGSALGPSERALLHALDLVPPPSFISNREACLAAGQRVELLHIDLAKMKAREQQLQNDCAPHLSHLQATLDDMLAAIRANFMPHFGEGAEAWIKKQVWIMKALAKRGQVRGGEEERVAKHRF